MWRTVVVLAVLLIPAITEAQARKDYTKNDWPVQAILRPLTLAPEMSEIRGDTFVITLNPFGEPFTLAPDVYTAVTRRLTIGVTHELGLCINEAGCTTTYNDVGLEALFAAAYRGPVQVALRGGARVPQFDRFFGGVHAGVVVRLRSWRLALVIEPSIYIGVFGRADLDDAGVDARGRRQLIDVPAMIQAQLTSRAVFFVKSGVQAPSDAFGDEHSIPFGIGGVFALNHRVDLGAEIAFANAFGTEGATPTGIEKRVLFLRAALRL